MFDAKIIMCSTMCFCGIPPYRYAKASSCVKIDMESFVLQVQLMNLFCIIRCSPQLIFFGAIFDLIKPRLTHLCLGMLGAGVDQSAGDPQIPSNPTSFGMITPPGTHLQAPSFEDICSNFFPWHQVAGTSV